MSLERARTTCTFCQFGCELEIVRNGRAIVGVEYPTDAKPNAGRLCPRGSASALLLDHPQRLCYPLKNGKEHKWQEFFDEVAPRLRNCPSNELALTYGRNLTDEEIGSVFGLAEFLGTDTVVAATLEADMFSRLRLEGKQATRALGTEAMTQDEIAQAETILLVGDVFSRMPVIAKPILDARYADRSHRLYVLDSVKTREAGFAHRFLWSKPGTEPLVLLGITALLDRKLSGFNAAAVAEISGVSPDDLAEVAQGFDKAKKGLVIAALQTGRTVDPSLLAGALQIAVARMKGRKKLVFANHSCLPLGMGRFSTLLERVEKGEIKALLSFGDGFPNDYPMLTDRLRSLDLLVTVATLRGRTIDFGWVLPVPLDLEKNGHVPTIWGRAELAATAKPVSGARMVSDIIAQLAGQRVEAEVPSNTSVGLTAKSITDRERAILKGKESVLAEEQTAEFPFVLLSEQEAYSWQGIFAREGLMVAVSPTDAQRMGLSEKGAVVVENTQGASLNMKLCVREQVASGSAVVDYNKSQVRKLFKLQTDEILGLTSLVPTRVKIWRRD